MAQPVTPSHLIDIFLQPGEWCLADQDYRIRTLLGSCVSVTCWHAASKTGGMTHFLLPTAHGKYKPEEAGRYADSALQAMLQQFSRQGIQVSQLQMKLFGGASMFSGQDISARQIGQQNISAARQFVQCLGGKFTAEHVGGQGHRNLIFEIGTGHVWLRQVKL
jgi:chemotaxis protein CheD